MSVYVEGLQPVETEDEAQGWAGVIQRVGGSVLLGGEWRPPGCVANTHLAVVIPCRDRDTHLRIMLRHLIPILQRQLTHFRIFVVEQVRIGDSRPHLAVFRDFSGPAFRKVKLLAFWTFCIAIQCLSLLCRQGTPCGLWG